MEEKNLQDLKVHLHSVRTLAGLMALVDPDRPVAAHILEGCGRVLVEDIESIQELLDQLKPKQK